MSKDGDSVKIFHELCDNKGPTVILTKIKKGNIIGDLTPLSWDCISNGKCDLESFLFSLTDSRNFQKQQKVHYLFIVGKIMVLGFLISDLDIKLKKTQNYMFQIFLYMKMEMK